jgi:hypothetical protein
MKKRGFSGKEFFIVVFLFLLFLLGAIALGIFKFDEEKQCADGTSYGKCSQDPPYYCSEGKLIEYSSLCKCPFGWNVSGRSCVSEYMNGEKRISLDYFFEEEKRSLDFFVFEGVYEEISEIQRNLKNFSDNDFSRKAFKKKAIENDFSSPYLFPLVVQIQNSYENPFDQVSVAVSLVQNLPYEFSEKKISFYGREVNYSRYPYEVLYEEKGICSERVDLLSFILGKLGYGVVVFYFPVEDHEAVGIKCPKSLSFQESGYCFIETTFVTPYGDFFNKETSDYGLSSSYEIIPLYEGKVLRKSFNLF